MKTASSWILLLFAAVVLVWIYAWHRLAEAGQDQYKVVYEQDFSDDDAMDDFQFSDPAAWRLGKTEEGEGYLDLFGKSQYGPPHTSPRNIALLTDKMVKDFVLDLELQQTGKEYGHRDMCVFTNFSDPANYYYTHIASKTDDRAHNVFIVDDAPRIKISHKTTDGHKWSNDGWHNVRIKREGDTILVFVDNMETPIMEANNGELGWGYVGIGSFDDTGRVRKLKLSAPEAREGDKEKEHFKKPEKK